MSFGPNMTATTRERPTLAPVETDVAFQFIHINKCGGSSIEIALGLPKNHDTALERRDQVGRDAWDDAYTFATVRNPFARVVSIYYYRVRTDQGGMADRHLNINEWVQQTFAEKNPRYWADVPLLAPAVDWLCDGDDLIVEHIARLEDLPTEWPRICARLGVSRDLHVFNNNLHPPYRAVLNGASRATIERYFAADLDRFAYQF